MTERTSASWLVYLLGALCVGAIAAAVLVVGPASGSQASVTRTASVAEGVVQSTVSGSGNLQALSQLNLGFKTSGTITHIDVTQGEQVAEGQLLAELDPESAEVTLEQSKAALQSAEANLAKEEETDGEGSSGSSGTAATASAASLHRVVADTAAISAHAAADTTAPDTSTTPAGTTTTTTTPSPPTSTTTSGHTNSSTRASSAPKSTSTDSGTNSSGEGSGSSSSGSGSSSSSSSSSSKTTISAATREANLASARAQVRSDALTVQGSEQAVQDTKLYAPQSGTIVSLSGQVGEVVSGSGTTKASSASSSSESSASGSAGASTAGRSATGASSSAATSSDSSSSSSSAFAVLSDLSSMRLVVPLSESEIGNVKAAQIATVAVEALGGRKLAAHVSEVAILSTSNSGVVSYDVTFELDQMDSGLKPGMSATAEVVVKQAEGINVPTSAISADTVTVIRGGQHVRQRVITGLAGNSSTIILSGLKVGETIVLPSVTTTSTRTSTSSRTGALSGAGGFGGGAGGFGGAGGGPTLFRGGG